MFSNLNLNLQPTRRVADSDGWRIVRLDFTIDFVDDGAIDLCRSAEADRARDRVGFMEFLQSGHPCNHVDLRCLDFAFGRLIGSRPGHDGNLGNAWTLGSRFFSFSDPHDFRDD